MADRKPTEARVQLPVYLPGKNKDWRMDEALATISDDGMIHIKMLSREATEWLIECVKTQALMQVSFDYRMNEALIEAINHKYNKE